MIKTIFKEDELYALIEKNINNNFDDISDLIELQYNFLNGDKKKLVFQFTDCEYINAAIAVIIGALPAYAPLQQKSVKFKFDSRMDHPVLRFMKDVGMYDYYTRCEQYAGENAIPFNKIENEKKMEEYTDKIMSLAPIQMEKEAQCILSSYIYEIYQNGLFHSKSPIGVFTSGLWMPDIKEFVFSIYDMGVGIPYKIREHMKTGAIDSEKCLKIAFVEGFTTSEDEEVNRGLGLSRLENFTRLNNGNMKMFTDDICCIIDQQKEKKYYTLKKPIKGTLIVMNIIADEKHIYVVE